MKKRRIELKEICSDPERPVPLGNSADAKLLSCHLTPVPADLEINEHEHSHWELTFMISGEMKTFCEGKTVQCQEDDAAVLLIPPMTFHRRKFGNSGNNCNLTIEFLINNADCIRDAAQYSLDNSYLFRLSGFLSSLLEEIRRLSRENMENPDWLLAQLSQIFLLTFLREILHAIPEQETFVPVTWKFQQDHVRAHDIFRFLNTRISSKHIMSELHDSFGLSLRQLNRIFKREYRKTISEMHDDIRFKRSVLLLQTTELTIREIAEETGFTSPAGFFRFFGRHAELSPHAFRQQK